MTNQHRIGAVILDWAGTMVDYGSFAPVEAFRRMFAQRGVEVSFEAVRRPMGRHESWIISGTSVRIRKCGPAWNERFGTDPEPAGCAGYVRGIRAPMLMSTLPHVRGAGAGRAGGFRRGCARRASASARRPATLVP